MRNLVINISYYY